MASLENFTEPNNKHCHECYKAQLDLSPKLDLSISKCSDAIDYAEVSYISSDVDGDYSDARSHMSQRYGIRRPIIAKDNESFYSMSMSNPCVGYYHPTHCPPNCLVNHLL